MKQLLLHEYCDLNELGYVQYISYVETVTLLSIAVLLHIKTGDFIIY